MTKAEIAIPHVSRETGDGFAQNHGDLVEKHPYCLFFRSGSTASTRV